MSEASSASAESGAEPRRDEHVQVAKGAGLTGIGAIVEGVIKYVSMLLVTSQYGKSAYGVFGFVMMFNELGQRVSSAGLHDGVMRHVAVHQSRGEVSQTRGAIRFALQLMLAIGVAYALGLWAFAGIVADKLSEDPEVTDVPRDMIVDVVRISCFALPTTAALMLLGRALRALKQIGAQVIAKSLIAPISRVILIVLALVVFGSDELTGLAWAIVISSAIACCYALWAVHRKVQLLNRAADANLDKREFFGYALPLVGVDIVSFFSVNADVFLLGYLTTDQGMLGVYMAVVRFLPILGMPLMLFSSLLTPLSAQLHGEGRMTELRHLYQTSVRWIFAVGMPFVLVGIFWSDPVIGHIGEGFEAGGTAFMLLAVTLVINGFANPAGYAVTMAGYSKLTLVNAIVTLAAVGTLGFWLIPEHGVLGAAMARAGGILANCALTLAQGYIILGLNPLHKALVKPVIGSLIGAGVAYGLLASGILGYSLKEAFVAGIIISAIYGCTLVVLGLDQEDKDVLWAGSKPLHGLFRKFGWRPSQ